MYFNASKYHAPQSSLSTDQKHISYSQKWKLTQNITLFLAERIFVVVTVIIIFSYYYFFTDTTNIFFVIAIVVILSFISDDRESHLSVDSAQSDDWSKMTSTICVKLADALSRQQEDRQALHFSRLAVQMCPGQISVQLKSWSPATHHLIIMRLLSRTGKLSNLSLMGTV